MSTDRPLGWDDEISNDDQYTLLPEGKYPFEVVNLTRDYFQGSAKMPACPKAEVTLRVREPNGNFTDTKDSLLLHTKTEWRLCAFFRSIGQRKHGDPLRPRWDRVIGSKGMCEIKHGKYTGKDGVQKDTQNVNYLDPAAGVTAVNSQPAGETPF